MQASNSAFDGDHEPDTGQQRQTNGADQTPAPPPPDTRSAWPPTMAFASCLQQGSGFNTTNTGYHKHRPAHHHNGFGQPKQPRQQNFVDRHELLPEVLRLIDANYRVLVCMRGAPGSGKSYLARVIVDRTMNGNYADHIFTTDDHFVDARTKQYRFDRSRLSEAHERNQARVARRAADGWSPIVVDNTNMKVWEMQPYFREAVKHGYLIRILEPNTPWRIAVGKLAQRNSHGVDQEQIARMLTNYEPASVQDVLHSMQIFNYDNPEPRLRHRPDIVEVARGGADSRPSRFQPRDPQRPFYQTDRNHAFRPAAVEVDDIAGKLQECDPFDQEWQPFEQETEAFWGTEPQQAAEPTVWPAPPKVAGDTNIANMYKILQDRRPNEAPPGSGKSRSAELLLRRHKKFCRNENQAFQEVRQICPNIPVRLLWDLFEKCNGDGDWTVDLILNERESMGIETLDTQEQIDRDNFACDCDRAMGGAGAGSEQSALAAAPPIAADTTKSRIAPSQPVRRKQQLADPDHEVRRQINGLFVIPDKHYSQHTRKIRDIRYGAGGAAAAGADEVGEASGGADADDGGQEEPDEIIEMDLGIGLVCQLDRSFGSTGLQQDQLKSLKTTVFMPKTLGQQLYAIWVESLYNQLEEQRHQSVKDDEEFAKELHKQEQTAEAAGPPLAAIRPPIADIADIELAWKAYNTNFNEWKQTTPEDLATKLTKDKLFEIFPHVDRQQLLHVFSAYSNNFRSTVDFFKEELKSDVDKNLLTSGQKLLDHVRLEAETIRPYAMAQTKSRLHRIQEKPKANKMDAEEAKNAALKDFEENRNLAMHHSHMKAECYNKARDAFQRRQTAVAYYYTNIAQLHNSKIDKYNNRAANAIVEVHSYTQQNPDMLDLHYLHAAEAIECLDIYLDQHITGMKEAVRGTKHVFIITGRGLHSAGGFSTIKHRVKCRLRERTLTWSEVNPGLLKVKLQYISAFAKDVPSRR